MSSAPESRVDISSARTLGIVGSILMLFIPVVGIILMAIAVRDISRKLERPGIWRNFLLSLVAGIVGIIALVSGVILVAVSQGSTDFLGLYAISTGIFIAYIAAFVLLVIGIVFLRRSLRELSEALGIRTFSTAGTLYLVGLIGFLVMIITIVLASIALGSSFSPLVSVLIGILVLIPAVMIFVGNILLIVAFVRTPKEITVEKL